jgi:2-dehydropantoate 2-reductase
MKICIYGAGAIGGYLGVQLARAGADVSLVARNPSRLRQQLSPRRALGRAHRVERLSALFVKAGMQASVLDRRDEIWLKLWGNVCLNPISALTYATLDVICSDPATRALSKAIMLETKTIAETFGVKFRVDVERRIEGARKVGTHKTSMLQDLERGRPMEIDPLVTVVQEMGRLTQTPTPALDAVLALVAQRAKLAGLYGDHRTVEVKSPVFA